MRLLNEFWERRKIKMFFVPLSTHRQPHSRRRLNKKLPLFPSCICQVWIFGGKQLFIAPRTHLPSFFALPALLGNWPQDLQNDFFAATLKYYEWFFSQEVQSFDLGRICNAQYLSHSPSATIFVFSTFSSGLPFYSPCNLRINLSRNRNSVQLANFFPGQL